MSFINCSFVSTTRFNTMSQNISLWLRDTYATINDEPLSDIFNDPDTISPEIILQLYNKGLVNTGLFMTGTDMYKFLKDNPGLSSMTITIVIRRLRDLLWNNRNLLSLDELPYLQTAMKSSLPIFKNIFDYDLIQKKGKSSDIPIFYMTGELTIYNVIHISVSDYIQALNINVPISVEITGTPITLILTYTDDDFWDSSKQELISNVNI